MGETFVIWKYELEIQGFVEVSMPKNAELLHVDNQNEVLTLWALVSLHKDERETRKFRIFGTGNNIKTSMVGLKHVGTALIAPHVWHVFEHVR